MHVNKVSMEGMRMFERHATCFACQASLRQLVWIILLRLCHEVLQPELCELNRLLQMQDSDVPQDVMP